MKLVEGGRFAVQKSFPGMGDGLFAVHALSQGDFILEYQGERIPSGTAEDGGSRYLFLIDDEWTIDGPVPENIAGYINHACEPNCEATLEDGRIMFYAKRAIRSGEELSIDYGPEYFEKFIAPTGCRCSSCRNP
jgi:SET domain-containing protein